MSQLSEMLPRLTASASRRPVYPTPTEEAEEIRYLETLFSRLPDAMIAVAKQGRNYLDIMRIEQRHCDRMYYAYRFPLLGSPRYKKALDELKGAAAFAVKWIRDQDLTPIIRRQKCHEQFESGITSEWHEEILTATWPRNDTKAVADMAHMLGMDRP